MIEVLSPMQLVPVSISADLSADSLCGLSAAEYLPGGAGCWKLLKVHPSFTNLKVLDCEIKLNGIDSHWKQVGFTRSAELGHCEAEPPSVRRSQWGPVRALGLFMPIARSRFQGHRKGVRAQHR